MATQASIRYMSHHEMANELGSSTSSTHAAPSMLLQSVVMASHSLYMKTLAVYEGLAVA